MTEVEYVDTEGNPLKVADIHHALHMPSVGTVLEFETCQAAVESVTQLAFGIDIIQVIARCRVLRHR